MCIQSNEIRKESKQNGSVKHCHSIKLNTHIIKSNCSHESFTVVINHSNLYYERFMGKQFSGAMQGNRLRFRKNFVKSGINFKYQYCVFIRLLIYVFVFIVCCVHADESMLVCVCVYACIRDCEFLCACVHLCVYAYCSINKNESCEWSINTFILYAIRFNYSRILCIKFNRNVLEQMCQKDSVFLFMIWA